MTTATTEPDTAEPFTLAYAPIPPALPRGITLRALAILDSRRPWVTADVKLADSLVSRASERNFWVEPDDQALLEDRGDTPDDLIDRVEAMATAWERIAKAPTPPTTAQVRNQFRRRPMAERAADAWDKIEARCNARGLEVVRELGGSLPKTHGPRVKAERKALGGDKALVRLCRHRDMLERRIPGIRSMAWNAESARRSARRREEERAREREREQSKANL